MRAAPIRVQIHRGPRLLPAGGVAAGAAADEAARRRQQQGLALVLVLVLVLVPAQVPVRCRCCVRLEQVLLVPVLALVLLPVLVLPATSSVRRPVDAAGVAVAAVSAAVAATGRFRFRSRGTPSRAAAAGRRRTCRWAPGWSNLFRYATVLRDIGFNGPMELEAEYPLGGAESGAAALTLPRAQVLGALKRDVLTIRAAFAQSGTGLTI